MSRSKNRGAFKIKIFKIKRRKLINKIGLIINKNECFIIFIH